MQVYPGGLDGDKNTSGCFNTVLAFVKFNEYSIGTMHPLCLYSLYK